MLFNLLTESNANNNGSTGGWGIWIILLGFLVLMIAYNYISGKKRREQAEAEKEKRNAIQPGFKIVTIGGIVGTVVEVDDENNTFVLATGTEENPSYVKFDKVAIYTSEDPSLANEEQDVADEEVEESVTEENVEETVTEENVEEQND